jgi:DNA helicase-2/ATP-dependent DNA helicase PcrA
VPYEIIGGLKFYDRKEIKDIIAYLRVILTPQDSIAWKRIVNVPTRKIGPTTIERVIHYVESSGINFLDLAKDKNHITNIPLLKTAAQSSLTQFCILIEDIETLSYQFPARILIEQVLQATKYRDYLEENFSPPDVEAKMDNISELKNLASHYDEIPPRESLMHFLEDISLITAEQENE